MATTKTNIAYLATFQKMYFTKDVFLIPYYLARKQQVPLKLVYGSNQGDVELPENHRNVELVGNPRKLASKFNEISDWFHFILPKARHINSLFFCGCSAHHMILTWLLLKLNPKVSVVVFGDMEEPQALDFLETGAVYGKGLSAWMKRRLTNFFFNHVKFPVANERAYAIMQQAYELYRWHGLVSLYPCLDDELFFKLRLTIRPWEEKDKIMISVGRIGNHQKNTDMMLEALTKVNLKDWRVYLIGPITDSFTLGGKTTYKDKIAAFYKDNPHLREKVVLTGMIYDQTVLFDYFVRAKVYISSARHEGFANVYSQAAACGCYIVSTDVGGAETASNNWRFGTRVEQEDAESMACAIQRIIDNEDAIDIGARPTTENFLYSKMIESRLVSVLN